MPVVTDNIKKSNDDNESKDSKRWSAKAILSCTSSKKQELCSLTKTYEENMRHLKHEQDQLEQLLSEINDFNDGNDEEHPKLKQVKADVESMEKCRAKQVDALKVETETVICRFAELNKQARARREKYDNQIAALKKMLSNAKKAEGIFPSTPNRRSKH